MSINTLTEDSWWYNVTKTPSVGLEEVVSRSRTV